MNILVDHNLRGHSVVLAGSLAASGWFDLISIRFVLFEEVGLEINSDDRVVWRCAQANEMILLTASWSAFPCLQLCEINLKLSEINVLCRPKGYPHSRASRFARPEGSPLG